MRVLHVISDENIGGAGVLLTSLLKNMNPCEMENVVALPKCSALKERIETAGGQTVLLEDRVDRLSANGILEIKRVIQNVSPDLVHTNAAFSARIAARLCHVPILYTRHCSFPLLGVWKNPILRGLGGVCNRKFSDAVIATAEAAKRDLLQMGIPEEKIFVIINGSEPIRAVSESELQKTRKKFGIDISDFCVGICARLVPCKGHKTFLEAAKILCTASPEIPFRFLIVGDGEEETELKAYTKTLGLSDRVVFTGFVEDMANIYHMIRVSVNCSTGTETSCLALSEAMSAGVPCVVSDYGGNAAMIGDSMAGFVYPVGDAVTLSTLILKIATDSSLEEAMKKAAYSRYQSHYTAKEMANKVAALYQKIVAAQKKTDLPSP